jgi:hypothetical protein
VRYATIKDDTGQPTWSECEYDEDPPYVLALECRRFYFFRNSRPTQDYFASGQNPDQVASCAEARYVVAQHISTAVGSNWGGGAGFVQENCWGPHPSGSSRWVQAVNPPGSRWFDCIYDEDPGVVSFKCYNVVLHRNASNVTVLSP